MITKQNFKFIISITAIFFIVAQLKAQETVNISGGDAVGSGGSAAFSVGLVVYTTHFDNTGSIAQGVQHAYEVFASDIKEENNLAFTLYPNPTSDIVTLLISNYEKDTFWYQLCDMQGRILKKGSVNSQQTQLSLQQFPTSTYFISIWDNKNVKLKSFRVVKR